MADDKKKPINPNQENGDSDDGDWTQVKPRHPGKWRRNPDRPRGANPCSPISEVKKAGGLRKATDLNLPEKPTPAKKSPLRAVLSFPNLPRLSNLADSSCSMCINLISDISGVCPSCKNNMGTVTITFDLPQAASSSFAPAAAETVLSIPAPALSMNSLLTSLNKLVDQAPAVPVDDAPMAASSTAWQEIVSLAHVLQHAQPRTIFVFDLDETIMMTSCSSALLSQRGLHAFQRRMDKANASHSAKHLLRSRLHDVLNMKQAVEPGVTESVISSLQIQGHWVIALTSRYSHIADSTESALSNIGIDFTVNQPDHVRAMPDVVEDLQTGAMFRRGCIYTNACDKGAALDRFLCGVAFQQQSSTPSQIVFVDDRVENVSSVAHGMHGVTSMGVPVRTFLFTGAASAIAARDAVSEAVVELQVEEFISSRGSVLSNDQAAACLRDSDCKSR